MPDLETYTPHRTVTDAAFEDVAVPGLEAHFFHRPDGGRTASAGRYALGGRILLLAWGWTDEEHCSHHAVHDPAGFWHPETEGCPVVQVLRDGPGPDAPVTGLAVKSPSGAWLTASHDRIPARRKPRTLLALTTRR
jgi:hypothetical protein